MAERGLSAARSDRARMRQTVGSLDVEEPLPENRAGMMDVLPFLAGPAGRAVAAGFRSAPGVMAGGLGLLGFGLPSQAGDNLSTAQQTMDPQQLYTERATLQQRIDASVQRRDQMRPTNRTPNAKSDPRWADADTEVRQLEAQKAGLEAKIANVDRLNSPEYRLELSQMQQEQADAARAKRANTPFKEIYADYMPYVAPAAMLGAGFAGAAIKAPYARVYNQEMADLSNRWKSAATGRTPNPALADELGSAFGAQQAQGIGGTGAAVGTGIGIGELSQIAPLAIDYQRAQPGSALKDQVMSELTDPYGLAGRMLQGAALGGIPAKIGSTAVGAGAQTYHKGYAAETAALRPPPNLPGAGPGPGGGPLVGGAAGGQLGPQPPQPPPPRGPANPQPGSPSPSPYDPSVHTPISRQYIDELLLGGQALPPTSQITADLSGRYAMGGAPSVGPANLTRRANQTRPVLEALQGLPPDVQNQVLSRIMGNPGFLAMPLGFGMAAYNYPQFDE